MLHDESYTLPGVLEDGVFSTPEQVPVWDMETRAKIISFPKRQLLEDMTDTANRDFLAQYKLITNKLKKRFLRKPNVTEAGEQYSALSSQLQQEEQLEYAGFCCLAVAKCEQNLGSLPGETAALLRAARLFLQAEKNSYALGCPSFEESLQAAVGCYGKAISLHIEQKQNTLAAGLCIELGDALMKMKHTNEACSQYQRAADLQAASPIDQIHALGQVASCKIKLNDFDRALSLFNEMVSLAEHGGKSPVGVYCDILHRCEVTRVLLLLILQPTPQKLSPELASLLEKYAWAEDSVQEASFMCEDLFLLLQSVVMACQTQDSEALIELEADLWSHLNTEQKDLMRTLVNAMDAK